MDPSKRRRAPGKDSAELSAAARALVASIGDEARPRELATAFPRIVNRMAELWRIPEEMNRYFEQLLTDKRGGRKGFPLGIVMELTLLKDYYQSKVFPVAHDAWDQAQEESGRKF